MTGTYLDSLYGYVWHYGYLILMQLHACMHGSLPSLEIFKCTQRDWLALR